MSVVTVENYSNFLVRPVGRYFNLVELFTQLVNYIAKTASTRLETLAVSRKSTSSIIIVNYERGVTQWRLFVIQFGVTQCPVVLLPLFPRGGFWPSVSPARYRERAKFS